MTNVNNTVSIDASALNRIADVLKDCPAEINTVTMQVLWSLRDDARAGLAREIPKVYATNSKMIRSAITKARRRYVRIGNTAENEVVIEVIGERINLVRFTHTPTKPVYGKKRLRVFSTVTILRDRGRIPFKPWTGSDGKPKNMFLMKTGGKGEDSIPFFFARRTGDPRETNEKLETVWSSQTVAIPQMMMNPKVQEPLCNYLLRQLDTRVTEKLLNVLTNAQRKAR